MILDTVTSWYQSTSDYFSRCVSDLGHYIGDLEIIPNAWSQAIDHDLPLNLVHKEICAPKVVGTALDGMTILHLSDLHLDGTQGAVNRIAQALNGIHVDLVVITGDFQKDIDKQTNNKLIAKHTVGVLEGVTTNWGVWATLGNHDDGDIIKHLENENISVLMTTVKRVKEASAPLVVAGIGSYHCMYQDLVKGGSVQARHPEDCMSISLSHTPLWAHFIAERGFDMMLSGHTHGRQSVLSHVNRRYGDLVSGVWTAKAYKLVGEEKVLRTIQGHTSSGIGTSGLPVRFGDDAEAAILTVNAPKVG